MNRHFSKTDPDPRRPSRTLRATRPGGTGETPFKGLAIAVLAALSIVVMVGALYAAKAEDYRDETYPWYRVTCELGGSIHPEFGTRSGDVPVFCILVRDVAIERFPCRPAAWRGAGHFAAATP